MPNAMPAPRGKPSCSRRIIACRTWSRSSTSTGSRHSDIRGTSSIWRRWRRSGTPSAGRSTKWMGTMSRRCRRHSIVKRMTAGRASCLRRRRSAKVCRSWSDSSPGTTCRCPTISTRQRLPRSRDKHSMRRAVAAALEEIAALDERIVVMTGDLGYLVLDRFAGKYPERFFNAGVAEQDMMGIATGLAEAGFIPFVYSISTFAVLRPYEFIRNGPVQHGLPVRIVGIGCGFDYGLNGMSHYGLEDVGVLRCLPELTIIAPADADQARAAMLATWALPGPIYYRIAKDDL